MKKCKVCGSRDNLFEPNRHTCIVCRRRYRTNSLRTKEGLIKQMYRNQYHRRKIKPEYTLEELTQWCLEQDSYHKLHKDWQDSGYKKALTPSINRLDNSEGYKFSNIEITTWGENKRLGHEHSKLGLIFTGNKSIKVNQYTLSGEFIKTYPTIRRAEVELGKDCHKEIVKCCKGVCKQCQGYVWRFDNGLEA